MSFLCFGSNETSTLSTTEKSSIQKWFKSFAMRLRFPHHHFLNGIKKFLCDNRFVLSLKNLSVIPHQSCIDRIFEKFLIIRHRKFFSAFSLQSKRIKLVAEVAQSEVSCCIGLKCLFDKRGNIFIRHNSLIFVHITKRRHLRPYSFLPFVEMTSFDILA